MEYTAPATLVTPGPDITFNGGDYQLDPDRCSGLDQAPLRTVIDPKPQTDGGLIHANLRDVRRITLGGVFGTTDASARNTLEASLLAALEAIEEADGTLTITPTGQSAKVLTVRCEIPLSTSGYVLKGFLFGLVAVNPNFA